jgi:hypothetical protein
VSGFKGDLREPAGQGVMSALTALGERALVIQHIERWRDKPFITDYERALLDALIAQIRAGMHVEGP